VIRIRAPVASSISIAPMPADSGAGSAMTARSQSAAVPAAGAATHTIDQDESRRPVQSPKRSRPVPALQLGRGRPRETGEVSTGALAFPGVSRGTWGTPLTIIEQRGAERRYRCAPFSLLPHPPGISAT
jgi:hypothetical protein